MKTLAEVITFAMSHHEFADKLKRAAKNAVRDGGGTPSWRQLMSYFAQSPAELDELSDPDKISDPHLKGRAFRTALTYTSDTCPETIFSHDDEEAGAPKAVRRARRPKKPAAKARQSRRSAAKAKRSAK